ncbi:MAG: dTMP kinase [Bacteroidales bacterium]|nr:dTMP kinase [Bacteroidales bacterium]
MSGFFLSCDGLDGTGKTTQCQRLVDWLQAAGFRVTTAIDPGGTALGAKLREILLFGREHTLTLRAEALLFMASRAQLVAEVIRPALARGEIVVSDRFLLANVVYQGHAGGLAPETLWSLGQFATDGLTPDLTVLFDLPVEQTRERRKQHADRMEARAEAYQHRVREGFLTEAARQPECIVRIDASPPVEQVWENVRQVVTQSLRAKGFAIREGEPPQGQ